MTDRADVVLDVIGTCRSIRHYRPDPVPRATLERLVWAATRAPSPRNTQPWHFVVVTDEGVRARFARMLAPQAERLDRIVPTLPTAAEQQMYAGAAALIRAFDVAPAIVFVCGRQQAFGPPYDDAEIMYSALHTAAQNLSLAARAVGLSTAFTTFHLNAGVDRTRGLLGLPEDVHIGVTLPVGWAARGEGPVNRRPVEEVLHWESWGAAAGRPEAQERGVSPTMEA